MINKMFRKIILLTLIVTFLLTACTPAEAPEQEKVKHSTYDLPITERSFYLGLVPTPITEPETTWDDIIASYEETAEIAEIAMVWTDHGEVSQYEKLKQNKVITGVRVYGLIPVVTLNVATIVEVPEFGLRYALISPENIEADLSNQEYREWWVSEARNIARDFQPEYMSLGNEINDYFHAYPEQLDDYLSLLEESYQAIKEESPDTKVMVVFSYTHLYELENYDLFNQFDEYVDLFGLTSYPHKEFEFPDRIDSSYYSKINDYTDKPIAFTEIGWIGPEKEQAQFLVEFLELTQDMNLEMVNWLFLHEMELTGILQNITYNGTGDMSLKYANGTEKEVYKVWLDLKDIDYVTNK